MQNSNYSLYLQQLFNYILHNMKFIKSIFRGVKKVAKPFIDFPTWMGLSQLKENAGALYKSIKTSFVIDKGRYNETFEQAVKRLHLSEQDIQNRSQQFKILALVYLVLGLGIICYGLVLLYLHYYSGGFAAIAIACTSLALSFRNHFWFYQVKQRKLGCSVMEWFKSLVGKVQ